MLQARFISKDDAKLHCHHGFRLICSNKEAEAYSTRDAAENVDTIYKANADVIIVRYRSDANCESTKHQLQSHTVLLMLETFHRNLCFFQESHTCLPSASTCLTAWLTERWVSSSTCSWMKYLLKRISLHFDPQTTGNIARMKSQTFREVAGPVTLIDSIPIELRTATYLWTEKWESMSSQSIPHKASERCHDTQIQKWGRRNTARWCTNITSAILRKLSTLL